MYAQHKKRSYSPVYKIYRRIRFVRYRKKLIKQKNIELKLLEEKEKRELLNRQKEFEISERQQLIVKRKAEREEARKRRQEFKEEFRQSERFEKESLTDKEKEKFRKDRLFEKKKRKRMFRFYLKAQFRNFINSYRSVNIRNIKARIKEFRQNVPKRKRFAIISFNSTVLFLLSYFFLFLLSQMVTVISASFFDYPTLVYYYEIFFNISPDAWYHDSVKTIFSSGPLVSFVLGIVFLILYNNLKETTGAFKVFFLWGFLHSVNMVFGAMLVGTLFETGVGHVISWMYVMDTGRVMYSIISIFLLIIAGLMSTKQFLISGNTYYNELNRSNVTSFILPQVLMPYILGNIFLVILRQPRFVFYDTFTVITLFIPVLAIMATYRSYNELYFDEDEKKNALVWRSAGILAVLVIFFRVVLGIGIRFGG